MSEWTHVPLGRLFERQQRSVRPEDGVVTAFRDGQVALRSRRRADGYTEALQEIGYQGIRKGDLVIHAMDAFAGAIGVAEDDGKSSPVYSALIPRQHADPRFYAHYLRHFALSGGVAAMAQGVRERSSDFRWATAKTVPVPLPPPPLQRQIADYLDHETAEIDAFIADLSVSRKLFLDRQESQLAGAFRSVQFVPTDHRRRGQFNAAAHSFGQGWIPLGSVARVSTGSGDTQDADPDGEYPFFVRSDSVERSDGYTFDTEAVLTAGDGAGVGKVFHHFEGKFAAHQRVYVIEPSRAVNGRYLYWALRTFFGRVVLAGTAKSTVESLRRPMLTGFPLPAATLADQLEIAYAADRLESEVAAETADIDAAISLAKERRAALITAAVTGQIDVTRRQKPVVDGIQRSLVEVR